MSELALQLIAENKRTKNPSLDLGRTGLREIPDELFDCVWLEELTLFDERWDEQSNEKFVSVNKGSNNYLSEIPAKIANLQRLRILKVGGSYIDKWSISDTNFLHFLKNLQSLDLGFNQISDISFLQSLTGLQSLYLSSNQISDISFLQSLTGLQSLYLSSNQISDITFLQSLTGLQSLYLSFNQISDISFLQSLTGLQYLGLNNNHVSDIGILQSLTSLQSLDLRSNKILVIGDLQSLKNLKLLKLSSNEILDYSILASLTGLQSLEFSSNQISDYNFLQSLTGLFSLDLTLNEISDVSFLQSLTALVALSLRNNQISDYSFLQPLIGLQLLNLSSNQISDISFLKSLSGLKYLDLHSNQISDISFLQSLADLQSLSLSSNKISDISFLQSLTGLRSLDLSNNDISDISFLRSLRNLESLDLRSNQISDIGLEFIESLPLELDIEDTFAIIQDKIFLYGNDIKNIPLEVLNQGREVVIDYLTGELKSLNECKLIFVGDGSVGKTSLMRRLIGEKFDSGEKTTHGINKISWKELKNENGEIIKVNLWDFGGQHIQHSLHQFFFSQRVIYVLVLNPRNDEKANYWLEQIDKLGRDSEIFIVYNWKDEKDKQADYLQNFHELRKKYPALPEPFRLSCKTNDGLALFKEKLKISILKNEGLKTKYRKEWFNIKKHLEEEVDVETNYVEYDQYEKWCSEENYNDPDRRKDLLKILNSVGSIVYFDKPVLDNLQVLNPEWISTGAYAILTAEKTRDNKGDLSWNDLKEIFNEEKSVFSNKEIKIKYEEKHFAFILELMLEYRLLQKNPLENHSYLIPSAFGEMPLNQVYGEIKKSGRQYRIQFDSPFEMLIMHQFIAKNIINIKGKDYWHSGIYMKHAPSKTFALVETNLYSYRIECWIKGENVRGFWETIRNDFREIFNAYNNFQFREEVFYQKDNVGVFLPYNEMLDALKNRVAIIQYHPTYKLKNIDVLQVLGLFESAQQTQNNIEHNREEIPRTPELKKDEIFFSYAWGEEREKIVDDLYDSLATDGDYKLTRDKKDLGYRDLISNFMKEIGKGDFIFVAISDKYLRSEFCMFELFEIFRNSKLETEELKRKIFPVYVENISLNKALTQKEYIKHWQKEEDEWEDLKNSSKNFSDKQNQQLNKIKKINAELGDLMMLLSDMNMLTKEILSENNFEKIKEAIKSRTKEL